MKDTVSAPVRVWRAPLVLGVLTTVGLAAGLLGDGMWDAVAVSLLGAPVAAAAWHLVRSVRR